MKRDLLVSTLLFLGFVSSIQAGSLEDSYHRMCEKMQSCALKSVGESDLAPEMRAMILQSMEGACMSIQQQFSGVTNAHPLYDSASACLDSMAALSCEEMENQDEKSTPECARYEKMTANYSE